jgi:cytochrome c biogenesis protein CcmG/thiol:disulfide interchange protein DsbE
MTQAAGSTETAPAPASVNRKVLLGGLAVVVPLIVLLVIGLGRDPHQVRSPLIGRPAPAFTLRPAGGGEPIALEALRGRPVVLNFWATWCVPCFEEHGVLTRTARALGSQVQFLGVIYEDQEEAVQAFLERRGSSYPSLMDEDGKTAIAYGVYGVPETYFIDANGRVVDKFVGPLNDGALGAELRRIMGQP